MAQPDWPGTAGLPAYAFRGAWTEKSVQLPFATGNGESASTTPKMFWGTGNPNGVVTAKPGDVFVGTDTGWIWTKASGTATNTGWLISSRMYDVTAYGADASGTAGSSGAILRAADAADAAGGGIVLCPRGVFLLDATLAPWPSNVELVGQGRWIEDTTTKRGTVLVRGFTGTLVNPQASSATKASGIAVRNLTIEGQDVAGGFTGTALDLAYTVGAVIDDVDIHGNIGRAVHLSETFDSVYDRLWVRKCGDLANTIPAIDIDSSATGVSDRADFYSLHAESNYYTHMLVQNSGGGGVPKWVSLYGPKFHDFITPTGSQLTVPVVNVTAASRFRVMGGQFSYAKAEGLAVTGDLNSVTAQFDQVGSATVAQVVNITGGQRSAYDLLIATSAAPSVAKVTIGASASDHRVQLITTGSGTAYSNSGTACTLLQVQDGAFNIVAGALQAAGVQVVSTRRTGWSAWTGTATRSAIATSTATTANCAEAIKALIDDLRAHGLIGT